MKVVSQLSDTAVCGLQTDGCFGCEVETIMANQTKQVKDYSRYEFSEATAQAHDKWHEEHFAEELQRAFEQILALKTFRLQQKATIPSTSESRNQK